MLELKDEITRAIAQGDKEVRELSGAVRSFDVLTVAPGETFTIPANYRAFETHFVGNDGKPRTSQYIWVQMEDGSFRKFFPSTFTKLRVVYNEDNTPTAERMTAKGTAVDEYKKYPKVKDGIDALVGKKIKYADQVAFRTRLFTTGQVGDDFVPVFDIAA